MHTRQDGGGGTRFKNYRDEIQDLTSQIQTAVKRNESRSFSTERTNAASLLSEDFAKPYSKGSMSIKSFVRFLWRYHRKYEPGRELEVPVIDQVAYGLGVEIKAGDEFSEQEFEMLVHAIWEDCDSYTLEKTRNKISASSTNVNSAQDIFVSVKSFVILTLMKIYAHIFSPGLVKSVSVDQNNVGIRLYSTDKGTYINITSGVTDYQRTLHEAERIAEYLDENSDNTATASDFET